MHALIGTSKRFDVAPVVAFSGEDHDSPEESRLMILVNSPNKAKYGRVCKTRLFKTHFFRCDLRIGLAELQEPKGIFASAKLL
jgi:hypothetical protein